MSAPSWAEMGWCVLCGDVNDHHGVPHSEAILMPPVPRKPLDARGIVSHACPECGHLFFRIKACFSDYELAFYTLDGECDDCGALVTVPTPIDAPDGGV